MITEALVVVVVAGALVVVNKLWGQSLAGCGASGGGVGAPAGGQQPGGGFAEEAGHMT